MIGDESQLRVRAEIDERYVDRLAAAQPAEVYGRGLGTRRHQGKVTLVKRVMGKKTMFSQEASERKDLDVLQLMIELPAGFSGALSLQVDVDVVIEIDDGEPDRVE